jgi:Plasmid recombination enzyme
MSYCILRTAKLKTTANIAASLSHTFRDRPTDNADPARKAQNEPSDGRAAAEVLAGIKARLPDKRRRDAVLCVEYLIAASPEYFLEGKTGAAYFKAARQWLIDQHGAENVVFSAVHRDELTPHMVAYVVPIREGRLNAKHWLGGKQKLSAMQTDFAQTVGKRFGLTRGIKGSKARHTTVRQFYAAINAPAPALSQVEVSTPPLLGRESWAKTEGERIAAALQPVLNDAAKAAKWGRFQNKGRREAQATAKHQSGIGQGGAERGGQAAGRQSALAGELSRMARRPR